MGRPKGSLNRLSQKGLDSIRELVGKYGDPLANLLKKRARWEKIYQSYVDKPTGRINRKRLLEAEEWILKYDRELLPYTRPKLQAITTQDLTPHAVTVIRAPETISDTQKWLAAHKPKTLNNGSNASPAIERLQKTVDMADKLGITDDETILKEALKQ
jgi:hypothetical protein